MDDDLLLIQPVDLLFNVMSIKFFAPVEAVVNDFDLRSCCFGEQEEALLSNKP